MLMEMKTSNDAEFSNLLGVEFGWTEFLFNQLLRHRWKPGAVLDDMFTDIITSVMLELIKGDTNLSVAVNTIKANTEGDDDSRLDQLQRLMNRAIAFRFRSLLRRQKFSLTQNSLDHEDLAQLAQDNFRPEHELEAADMGEAIHTELKERAAKSSGFARTVLNLALLFFPDRCNGMGIRELCLKHSTPRGRKASEALGQIISATESVVSRFA